MPRKVSKYHKKHSMRGGALMDWLRKAHSHIKSNKLISKGLKFAVEKKMIPQEYAKYANAASGVAGVLGYGRRRRHHKLVRRRRHGGALMPAGY